MSGIVGLWNRDGRPIDRVAFERMTATLRHRAVDGEDVCVADSIALAHQHLWVGAEESGERQPIASPRGVLLAIDGRIDNRDELLRRLDLTAAATDAACALAAYERWGDRFLERLNGEFAVVVADVGARRLLLGRDAIGIRPLYYVHTPGMFAVASEIKALLAHPTVPARPDEEGLADYLMIDARPLDRQQLTCFAGVSAVVPSHIVLVAPDHLTTRRYWDFDTGATLRLRSFDEYAEAFGGRFAEAIKRRTRGPRPVAVSVSGGLDSSSIFCQAERLRRTGRTSCASLAGVSYTGATGSDADEQTYLQLIEREYGVAIDRFAMEPLIGLTDGAEDQVRAVEAPSLDYMWGISRELQRRASSTGARVLLSGHWGDQVLFSTGYLVDLFNRGAWRQIRRHTREYSRWFGDAEARILTRRLAIDVGRHHLPRPLVPPLKWLRRRLTPSRRDKRWFSNAFLERALRDANRPATIGSGFHSAHARSIYLEARSKYHVECLEWNNKIAALRGLDCTFPFLDRDVLAFLLATPGEMQNHAGVPRALLRESMLGILPDEVRKRRWKADFTGVVNRGVMRDLEVIVGALSRDSAVVEFGYVDRSRLMTEIARRAPQLGGDGDARASWDLADLYSLELWLRIFLQRV